MSSQHQQSIEVDDHTHGIGGNRKLEIGETHVVEEGEISVCHVHRDTTKGEMKSMFESDFGNNLISPSLLIDEVENLLSEISTGSHLDKILFDMIRFKRWDARIRPAAGVVDTFSMEESHEMLIDRGRRISEADDIVN